ncbi:MAG: nonstructural protein [Microvirus sp.]|nr:MAG: nonstructural protein [Microvirus sp.]
MKLKIISLFDSAVESFGRPIFVRHPGEALRSLSDQVNASDNNDLARHPQDYSLHLIGEFDEETGELTPCDPERLARAQDLKKAQS